MRWPSAHAFAENWGEGKTSSSDGQRFRAAGRGEATGQVNLGYGNEPGVLFYTHISDQYTPFYSKVIAANARDATYVLDGLLYHESDLRIKERYRPTVLLAAKTDGSVFYDKLTPSIAERNGGSIRSQRCDKR
jgi:TnpA family transposase